MLKLSANTRRQAANRRFRGPGRQSSGIGRTIRNVIIGAFVMTGLLVGAGAGYVWYEGRHPIDNTKVVEAAAQSTTPNIRKPTQPSPDAAVGVSVQTISSPIIQGSNAMITIKTNAGAQCSIAVLYNNVPSKDSGLIPKIADEFGALTWTWTVEPTVPIGTWPVNVTCATAKHSGMVRGDLKVEKAS